MRSNAGPSSFLFYSFQNALTFDHIPCALCKILDLSPSQLHYDLNQQNRLCSVESVSPGRKSPLSRWVLIDTYASEVSIWDKELLLQDVSIDAVFLFYVALNRVLNICATKSLAFKEIFVSENWPVTTEHVVFVYGYQRW